MHYSTPIDPCSSGSPVFTAGWEVVALHHAGSQKTPRLNEPGVYKANEGITLRAIRQAMAARNSLLRRATIGALKIGFVPAVKAGR